MNKPIKIICFFTDAEKVEHTSFWANDIWMRKKGNDIYCHFLIISFFLLPTLYGGHCNQTFKLKRLNFNCMNINAEYPSLMFLTIL